MAERDFTIGSTQFKLSKINALKQYHIVRRIAPILGELGPALGKHSRSMMNVEQKTADEQIALLAPLLEPIMNGFSKLSDRDSEYVLFSLLQAVEMKQEHGNWAYLANDSGLMFGNMELPILLQAAGRAFLFNLQGFFSVLRQASSAGQ